MAGNQAMAEHRSALGLRDYLAQALAVAEAELRKLRHDPVELFTRLVQPILWLVIFGQVMGKVNAIPTGGIPYLDFLAPGILAQSVVFIAIFYGLSAIWERDAGVLTKYLVSPTPRWALVLGKALGSGFRSLSQAIVILVISLLLGVDLRLSGDTIAAMFGFAVLGSAVFSTFSLIVACLVKTRERFMGIGQLLTMPLFFASNAIYPVSLMPSWLASVARINPLSYLVDALRTLMLPGASSVFGLWMDLGVLCAFAFVFILAAARLYPHILR
jgi:ABC-2 type transport system permease protein